VVLGIGAAWYFERLDWGLLWALAIPSVIFVMRLFALRKCITALAVTPQWIVVSRGLFPKRAELIEKREIGRATLWEHRSHLNLHRTGLETMQVEDIGDSEGLVEALGLPTRVWPERKAQGAGRAILYFTGGLVFTLWSIGSMALALLIWLYEEVIFAYLPEVATSLGLVVIALVVSLAAACIVAGAVGVVLARIAGGDALAQFIHAAGDPAWSGQKAEPGRTFRYLNAVARLTGATPVTPDTLPEPKIINGPLPINAEAFGGGWVK
ncbi:MAG: hypothetical protein IMF08_11295, partial [Proteobacteria bacterium]|nr:hypothetical protein [Pseudomonadota bacterium]